jgi:flagellar hook-associated protein 2
MSSTSSTNALFTGSSQFSSDLQQVVQRAVAEASAPLDQMQTDLTTLQSEQTAANTLNTDFAGLQSAVSAVETALTGASAYQGTVSNSAVASVALSGTPMTGSYSLDVTGMGAYATSMSNDGLTTVSDPTSGNISDATSYTLTVGNNSYTITPSGNTLSELADALSVSGQVQATLVNIGGPGSPDYRLSLEGTQLGDLPIQLTANDGTEAGQTLLTAETPPGSPAEYQVNGQPATPIQTSTPTVTIAPGVSVTLLGAGTATVSVNASTAALSNAFSQLASAYNTAMSDINQNRGQSGGALAGDSLLMTLQDTLQSIAGYSTGNSGLSSLTSLGFSFDESGVLSFDPSAFATATSGQITQLENFLGSSTTGGFLQAATNALTGIEDPTDGILPQDLSSLSDQITAKNQAISDQQDQVNQLQTNLTQQMATADASIASMEQQLESLQGYFQALQTEELSYAGM